MKLKCIECYLDYGTKKDIPAEFVVNGQSVCEDHIMRAVRDPGEGPRLYTALAPDGTPTLRPLNEL